MTMPAAMTMPVDEETLASLVDAARLSTSQLENVAQSILGASITSISNASTPAEQARDMVTYARQYGLLRQVAAAIIYTGADRPGLQNLLLGDEHMESVGSKQQNSDEMYSRLRMEGKLDRLIEEMQRNSQQLSLVIQQQAQLAQQQQTFDRRLTIVESVAPKPITMSDKFLMVMFAIVLVAMLAYNIIGKLP